MDRVVYVVASGAKQVMHAQALNANNLANANTVGFQADLANFRALQLQGAGFESRAYAIAENGGAAQSKGTMQATGRDLDVAVNGKGWIAVQAADGTEAYTRAGNLHLNVNGQLLTSNNLPVLGSAGPLVIPDSEKIEIGADGTVSARPLGQTPSTLAEVGRIKLVSPPADELLKGRDGLLRTRSGAPAEASSTVTLSSGTLEMSNVNGVEAMVNMITLARTYEVSVQMMKTAREMDESSTRLMNMG